MSAGPQCSEDGPVVDDDGPSKQTSQINSGTPQGGAGIHIVPLDRVKSLGQNPRRRLRGLDELSGSIKAYGLLQPVIVRAVGEDYVLLAGHRRTEAARVLGWTTIPAIVRSATENDAYIMNVVDNLQHQDLTAREEAAALEVLVREHGWSTRQVATAISRSQAFVSKRLRVFDDPITGPAVLSNLLTVSSAEELLSVPQEQRADLVKNAVRGKWDLARVRQAARVARFGPNHSRGAAQPGLARRVQDLRVELRDLKLGLLRESERRQLRMLFNELAALARAKDVATGPPVFPPLPGAS
jgi:ParB family chromosome partitioning protein